VARAELIIRCPQCGSEKTWRDGIRYSGFGQVQRYVCRRCGYRFSDPEALREIQAKVQGMYRGGKVSAESKSSGMSEHVERILTKSLKSTLDIPSTRQICVTKTKGAKNLAAAENQTQAAGISPLPDTETIKGKILEFLWQLEKNGRTQGTIRNYNKWFSRCLKHNVNLFDPEEVKGYLAKAALKERTKITIVGMLRVWYRFLKLPWDPPEYIAEAEIPFIPTEQELDQLIAGCGKKTATYLQLMKETGARAGEISKLTWTDVDFQQRVVRIKPEKGSLPRMLPLSLKAIDMLNNIPKNSDRIFLFADDMRSCFYVQRKRIARKLGNPRLLQISFHTFRHWKGTMEYHKTKDIFYVKELLGHKSIQSTQVYIHIERGLFLNAPPDDYHVKVAKTQEEITQLLETGFEYVLQKDGLAFFRKRK